jgi:hypothetical protein
VRRLPPYGALCLFVLPGLLLLPVKLLALVAIAHGHALSGIATIVVAKLGGAAVVARIYVLTLPTLLALGWFARCHGWFMMLKNHLGRPAARQPGLLASAALLRAMRRACAACATGCGRVPRQPPRQRSARVLRRFVVAVARGAANREQCEQP